MSEEKTFAFLLDLSRCIACQGCVAACKTGNELPEKTRYIEIEEITMGQFPELMGYVRNHRCYHCADAACVKVCPTQALYKEDGLTRLDQEPCIGCGECVAVCPYEVPRLRNKKSTKCDGCAAVVKAGGTPWCVSTCPSNALLYGEREMILEEAHTRVEQILWRYPNAQVYGETQAGGLGMLVVLPDDPEIWDLPLEPDTTVARSLDVAEARPLSMGFSLFGALTLGLAAIIERRNRLGGRVARDVTVEDQRMPE
jgi:formate dehydrogenase iron-sulfur subunit